MNNAPNKIDPIASLKQFTSARVALGRAGSSIPLEESLKFRLAHAHARDAVYSALDAEKLSRELSKIQPVVVQLRSKAHTRHKYLKRPDYGRQLDPDSETRLRDYRGSYDVAVILADGLSATAINENAADLLRHLMPMLHDAGLRSSPFCLVEQGRVAIGDDIGFCLNATISLVLIGERPGLSAADSMGAYLTYAPRPGLTDESRNCISNIRPQGLLCQRAACKIFFLITESIKRRLSGVGLKDEAELIG